MERKPFFAEPDRTSRYLDELPALYSQEPESQRLGRFLLAFEQILTGLGEPQDPGLEEVVEGIPVTADGQPLAGLHRFFDPGPGKPERERAPEEFLAWLAGWVALDLRSDWDEATRRRILAEIVPVYRLRGTPEGLRRILTAYTGLTPSIQEPSSSLRVGGAVVGESTFLGGGPAHYFRVEAFLPGSAAKDLARAEEKLRAVIDAEKPAHTFYDLRILIPTMQIGVHSTVGVDTVLGNVAGDAAVSP
jgi:phage tail-like protein